MENNEKEIVSPTESLKQGLTEIKLMRSGVIPKETYWRMTEELSNNIKED
ncbi:hypothetical protein [Clostridium omnivorum]|uniref:Uncharacterized protein n=1 Tax=Clostridium omnivorum TaxID=1604902 RepID=A0ABQ5N7K1_9CLOT|nr:hypothetical protein [Clostridium sp. E14]GLC31145.1 hypothetical protein bsdE14_25550 [Clostridium sp. E14]